MNKKVILFFAIIFELAGSFCPMIFGNNDLLSGVWVGVVVSKRYF